MVRGSFITVALALGNILVNSSSDKGSSFSSSYSDAPVKEAMSSAHLVFEGALVNRSSTSRCSALNVATSGLPLCLLEVLLSVVFPRDKCS